MATNRKRTMRTSKTKIPAKISNKYRDYLTRQDFLGRLDEAEIPVAKKAGIHRWDLWKKAGRVATLTGELHQKDYLLAPVFGPDGQISNRGYKPGIKASIANYEELTKAQGG